MQSRRLTALRLLADKTPGMRSRKQVGEKWVHMQKEELVEAFRAFVAKKGAQPLAGPRWEEMSVTALRSLASFLLLTLLGRAGWVLGWPAGLDGLGWLGRLGWMGFGLAGLLGLLGLLAWAGWAACLGCWAALVC